MPTWTARRRPRFVPATIEAPTDGNWQARVAAAADAEAPELLRLVAVLAQENARLRSELSEVEALKRMAYRDPLTNLWNRRAFDDRLAETLSIYRRTPSRAFSVLLVDLDHFKQLNDTYGHEAGDAHLRRTAAYLLRHARAADMWCRLGGDEFAALLPDTDARGAESVIARLRADMTSATPDAFAIDFSLGAATIGEDGDDLRSVLATADARMYQNKRDRRDGIDRPNPMAPVLYAHRPRRSERRS